MIEPRDAREAALLDLAHELGATVHYSDLPGTLRGVWDPNGPRILLRRRRIIPARAGFTTERKHRHHDYRDHPRSRGVYGRRS